MTKKLEVYLVVREATAALPLAIIGVFSRLATAEYAVKILLKDQGRNGSYIHDYTIYTEEVDSFPFTDKEWLQAPLTKVEIDSIRDIDYEKTEPF